jgi:hypothetical protein
MTLPAEVFTDHYREKIRYMVRIYLYKYKLHQILMLPNHNADYEMSERSYNITCYIISALHRSDSRPPATQEGWDQHLFSTGGVIEQVCAKYVSTYGVKVDGSSNQGKSQFGLHQ